MIFLFLFLSLILLFSKNIIFVFVLLSLTLIYIIYSNISLNKFLRKLDTISVFCISVFVSYIILGILKNNEALIFIYAEDATVLILKIIDILLINIMLEKLNIKRVLKNDFLIYTFSLMSRMENNLFEIINSYSGKLNKILNIHNIIVKFFISSLTYVNNETFNR